MSSANVAALLSSGVVRPAKEIKVSSSFYLEYIEHKE
jgi:hypothetical protein